jgi:hypothetical protein
MYKLYIVICIYFVSYIIVYVLYTVYTYVLYFYTISYVLELGDGT